MGRKISNQKPKFIPQETKIIRKSKTPNYQKEWLIKTRAKINEIENRKTKEKNDKIKSWGFF